MSLTIRRALPDERGALEDIQLRASLMWESDRAAILAHPDCIHVPPEQIAAGQVVVAERDGQVCGFASWQVTAAGHFDLDGLFTAPELWRQGIGRALVEEVFAIARTAGVRLIEVIANRNAYAFYRALGFAPSEPAQTRFGPAERWTRDL